MALDSFFTINLPYGIAKSETGEWYAFNREYLQLGTVKGRNRIDHMTNINPEFADLGQTKYTKLSESRLRKLAGNDPHKVHKNPDGSIQKVFFYDDGTNPVNTGKKEDWKAYCEKLELLLECQVKKDK